MSKLDDLLKQRAEIERQIAEVAVEESKEDKRILASAAERLHKAGQLHPEIERVFTDKRGVFSPYRVMKVGKGG